jgi:undecaprenyl diphosphate synthase
MPDPVPEELDREAVPRHVAIIMDGNGRWADEKGLPRTAGHAVGEHALFDVVHGALEIGVEWLTVYAFSTAGTRSTSSGCGWTSSVSRATTGSPKGWYGAWRRPRS